MKQRRTRCTLWLAAPPALGRKSVRGGQWRREGLKTASSSSLQWLSGTVGEPSTINFLLIAPHRQKACGESRLSFEHHPVTVFRA